MTKTEILLNYIKLEKPTNRQTKEVLKILIRAYLQITDDGYHINSLTGKKGRKVKVDKLVEDKESDEDIIKSLAADIADTKITETNTEIKKLKSNLSELQTEISELNKEVESLSETKETTK